MLDFGDEAKNAKNGEKDQAGVSDRDLECSEKRLFEAPTGELYVMMPHHWSSSKRGKLVSENRRGFQRNFKTKINEK